MVNPGYKIWALVICFFVLVAGLCISKYLELKYNPPQPAEKQMDMFMRCAVNQEDRVCYDAVYGH